MTVAQQHTSPTADTPPPINQQPADNVGVEVEDFGLEFDSPDPSEKRVEQTVSPAPPEPSDQSSATAGWYIAQSGGRQVGPFGMEVVRLRFANGWHSPDSLIWRPGMTNWEKFNSVPEFQTAPISAGTNSWQIPNQLMDWAHLSLIASGGLLVVSVLGGYWGYSWFTGALLFFLGYLIGRGFAQVFEMLSGIEARLSSSTRGTDQHD